MKQKDNVTVYICEHCGKKLFTKSAMVKHETNCTYNPANWAACIDCAHCKEVPKEYYNEGHYNEFSDGIRQTKGFTCTKLNQPMYPFIVVRKGLLEKYPEQFAGEIQMPEICGHHEFIW